MAADEDIRESSEGEDSLDKPLNPELSDEIDANKNGKLEPEEYIRYLFKYLREK